MQEEYQHHDAPVQGTLDLGRDRSSMDGAGADTATAAHRESRSSTLESMTTDHRENNKKVSTGPKERLAERKRRNLLAIERDDPLYSEGKDKVEEIRHWIEQESGMSDNADDVLSLNVPDSLFACCVIARGRLVLPCPPFREERCPSQPSNS